MTARTCEWCSERYDDTNGYLTEDGQYGVCSEECLSNLEQNLEENREQRRYEATLRERGY